jgi:hypothetical protein
MEMAEMEKDGKNLLATKISSKLRNRSKRARSVSTTINKMGETP